jgi:hypothetical protein
MKSTVARAFSGRTMSQTSGLKKQRDQIKFSIRTVGPDHIANILSSCENQWKKSSANAIIPDFASYDIHLDPFWRSISAAIYHSTEIEELVVGDGISEKA